MNCPQCGHANDAGARFCRRCGTALAQSPPAPPVANAPQFCAQCGAPVRPGARFCARCGAPQVLAPPSGVPQTPPGGAGIAPMSDETPLPTGPGFGYYASHGLWIAILLVTLIGALAAAWIYDTRSAAVIPTPIPITPPAVNTPAIVLVDPALAVVELGFREDGRFGLVSLGGDPASSLDDNKQLTYDPTGGTNNTRLWIDSATPIFGAFDAAAGAGLLEGPAWVGNVWRTLWTQDEVSALQEVAYTNSSSSGRADTIRIAYVLTNTALLTKTIGLRLMIDTLIGGNDGVPFIVPGRSGVTDVAVELKDGDIPDFIQALEYPDLTNPGVIVNLTLRGADATPPDRVVISAWCGDDMPWEYLTALGGEGHPLTRCAQTNDTPDSAVGLYFEPQPLAPGATRKIVQYYGLGSISSAGQEGARLALSFNRSVKQGDLLWITALATAPQAGESMRLELPPQLELVEGFEAEQTLLPEGDFTQVSWQARAVAPTDSALVTVTLLPEGVTETQTIQVSPVGITR